MASYSFLAPRPTNAILSDVDHIREIQWILAQLNPSLADDAPEDSKRLVPLDSAKTQYRFERLVDSSWKSVGKLMHDVDTLDGYHASTSAVMNTIPVYNADAKLVGDLTGNANTATTLKNIRKFQIGGIASGGSVNFDGSADATIEITQLTVNNANDTAINGVLTIKHGGTGGADATTARANLGVPAIDHSSTEKTFGVASTTKYGHSIGSDALNSTFTADKGYFFSPKGADDLNLSLRAFIAQEVGAAESAASSQVSALDSSLRALIAQEVAKCLPLSGGAMTGAIYHASEYALLNTTDDGNLIITAGTGWDKGGRFRCYGKDAPDYPGRTLMVAHNGSRFTEVNLDPDGSFKKNGQEILTSAGGTLTGPVLFPSGGSLTGVAGDLSTVIFSRHDDYAKPCVILWGGDGAEKVLIRAQSQNSINDFWLYPDGTATLGGHSVLTSAGGEMRGPLGLGGYSINNITSLEMTGSGHGGYIDFHYNGTSQDYTARIIEASVGRLNIDAPNGIHLNGKFVVTLVASWSSGNNWYRKWSDGWIEQGGTFSVASGSNNRIQSVSLHVPFVSNTYNVHVQATSNATSSDYNNTQSIEFKSTTTFSVRIQHSQAGTFDWYACGF